MERDTGLYIFKAADVEHEELGVGRRVSFDHHLIEDSEELFVELGAFVPL